MSAPRPVIAGIGVLAIAWSVAAWLVFRLPESATTFGAQVKRKMILLFFAPLALVVGIGVIVAAIAGWGF